MTTEEILSLGQELPIFLDEFSACFGRSEPRQHVADYIRGQMSDLPRKSVERIADFAGKPPRTMQELLRTDEWDHLMMRDRCQQMVLRDHFDPQGIGVFDSSEHSKKGNKTACVARMWCGRSGKVENCVSTVHLSYTPFDMSMRVMLDSTPYLPKPWHEDRHATRRGRPATFAATPSRCCGNRGPSFTSRIRTRERWFGRSKRRRFGGSPTGGFSALTG